MHPPEKKMSPLQRGTLALGAFGMAAAVVGIGLNQIGSPARVTFDPSQEDTCSSKGVCYGTVARSAMRAPNAQSLENDPVSLASPMGVAIMRDIATPHGIPARQVQKLLAVMDNNYSSIKEEVTSVSVGDTLKGGLTFVRPPQKLRNPDTTFDERTNPYLMPRDKAAIVVQRADGTCAGAYAITIQPGAREVSLTPTNTVIKAVSHASDISSGACGPVIRSMKNQMAATVPSV